MGKSIKQEIELLKIKANSDNWHEREEAGFSLRNILENNFDEVLTVIDDWFYNESDRIRRAVCLACMQRKAKSNNDRINKILKKVEILMKDDSLYVRKCCGPFVIGYLGYTYPNITLNWLKEQVKSIDVNVRTNAAKAFSQALGSRFPKEGIEILEQLKDDHRTRVKSAVIASLRNIYRKKGMSLTTLIEKFPLIYQEVLKYENL